MRSTLTLVFLARRASVAFNSSPQTAGTTPLSIQSQSWFPRFPVPVAQIVLSYFATQHDLDAPIRGVCGTYKISHKAPLTSLTDVPLTRFSPPLRPVERPRAGREHQEQGRELIPCVWNVHHGQGGRSCRRLGHATESPGCLGLRICDASVYPAIRLGPSSPLQKSWRRSSRRNILLTSLFDIFTPRESFTCRVFIASVNVSHCVCARMARQASSFGAPSTAYCPHTILGSFKSSIPIGEWRHK